jgi:uncharacterized protein YjbI with pentapeptide repeats
MKNLSKRSKTILAIAGAAIVIAVVALVVVLTNENLRASLETAIARTLPGTVVNGCEIKPYTQCPGADLSWADLEEANLSEANLSGADLSCANLMWADLEGANLSNANLNGADLSCARITDFRFDNANLKSACFDGAWYWSYEQLDAGVLCNTIMPNGDHDNRDCGQ